MLQDKLRSCVVFHVVLSKEKLLHQEFDERNSVLNNTSSIKECHMQFDSLVECFTFVEVLNDGQEDNSANILTISRL
jgi:hypothetical protein